MPWQDRLQEASFAGVFFHVQGSEDAFGRRAAVFEAPFHEGARAQDLGRRPRVFRIEAIFLGTDYDLDLAEFLNAIEAGASGELVHPNYGTHQVVISDGVSVRHSTREGGMAIASFVAVETVERPLPFVQRDTQSNTQDQVALSYAAVQADFESEFVADENTQAVEDAANTAVQSGFTDLETNAADIDQALPTAGNYAAEVRRLAEDTTTLVRDPAALALGISTIVENAMTSLAREATDAVALALALLEQLPGAGLDVPASEATDNDRQQADNARAVRRVFRGCMLTGVASVLAARGADVSTDLGDSQVRGFDSSDAAQAANVVFRDRVLELLDDDNPTDGMLSALLNLQTALGEFLSEAAGDLPRIVTYAPGHDVPAVLASQILYGEDRADDIVRRNNIPHPLLLPGSVSLEVLSG